MTKKLVVLGSDHRGYSLKAAFAEWLAKNGYLVKDVGTMTAERCDAGDYAVAVAETLRGTSSIGVLLCGTGEAMGMTANRYAHVRAALCSDVTTTRLTRQHNDANILVLGADIIGYEVALGCLETFLITPFLEGRYTARREKLNALGGL